MRLKLGTKQEITKDLALKVNKKAKLISRFLLKLMQPITFIVKISMFSTMLHCIVLHTIFVLKQQSNLDKGLPILSGAVA